jgi:hypothetical protein
MSQPSTFLAPGQRYTGVDTPDWCMDWHLTVVLIARDLDGVLRVACLDAEGKGVVEPAAQFEQAIAVGILRPVAGTGLVARC